MATAPRARSGAREERPAALSALRSAPATAPQAGAALPLAHALLGAAARGAVADVRDALAQGADVNSADARGRTALMLAAQRGDAPLVRLLLEAGADPLRVDRDGLRALDLAQQAGHAEGLPMLQERAPR